MDKKNTIIGVLLLAAAVVSFYFAPKAPPSSAPGATHPTVGSPATSGNQATGPATSELPAVATSDATFTAVASEDGSAKILTLANDLIEAHLTDLGGAIKDVAFKQYAAHEGDPAPFVFNKQHVDPILAFTRDSFPELDRSVRYEVVSASASEVVFRAQLSNGIEVTRRYSLVAPAKGDPYQIRHETTFRNLTDQPAALRHAALSVGTSTLLGSSDIGQHLNFGYNTGKDMVFVDRSKLDASNGLFGLGAHAAPPFVESNGAVVWAAAKSQYFSSIVTPDQPAAGTISRLVRDLPMFAGSTKPNVGITGALRFDLPATLAPKAETTLGMTVYVGPNEYRRLSNADIFKHDEDKIIGYARGINRIFLSGYFAPLMNQLMNWTASWVHNWGLAIIIGTLLIKIVTLPFNLTAARSAKRMQKLAPEMKAIQLKYKDNKQKQQLAMMELYKERKVNPMGGCLPMLIPMPFFFGFFAMLQSAPELRFAKFLWVKDLASPDTVAMLSFGAFHFPVNVLPLLLGVTMIVQMRLVPQPGMADNEQAQMMAKMMKWMPLMYVVFCYSFSCALALYSTVNGLFMIGQQLFVNRMKDPEFSSAATPKGAAMNAIKNVTPAKKKGR